MEIMTIMLNLFWKKMNKILTEILTILDILLIAKLIKLIF